MTPCNLTGRIFIDPVLATDDDNILIYGDVRVIADFGAGQVNGAIRNSEAGADTFDVNGTIALGASVGTIGGGRPNDFSTSYDGDIRIGQWRDSGCARHRPVFAH